MRIIHPHPVRGRQKFIGVEFIDGFAVVETLHPEVEAALEQHRFSIEHEAAPVELGNITIAELRDVADVAGIEYPARANKQKLIDLIEAAQNSGEEFAVVELDDGSVVGDGTSIVTLRTDGTATTED